MFGMAKQMRHGWLDGFDFNGSTPVRRWNDQLNLQTNWVQKTHQVTAIYTFSKWKAVLHLLGSRRFGGR